MLIDVCGGGQLGFSIHKKNESSLGNIQCLCMYRLDSIKFPFLRPEALKSLYRSPGYKKKQLVLCKNYVLQW